MVLLVALDASPLAVPVRLQGQPTLSSPAAPSDGQLARRPHSARSPRLVAADFNARSARDYLELSREELDQIWQREVRAGSERAAHARAAQPRHLALANGAARPALAPPSATSAAAAAAASAADLEEDVELALTSVVSLARTAKGDVVRRVVV